MAHPSLYVSTKSSFVNRCLRAAFMLGTMICAGDIVMSGIKGERQTSDKCNGEKYNNICTDEISCFSLSVQERPFLGF